MAAAVAPAGSASAGGFPAARGAAPQSRPSVGESPAPYPSPLPLRAVNHVSLVCASLTKVRRRGAAARSPGAAGRSRDFLFGRFSGY